MARRTNKAISLVDLALFVQRRHRQKVAQPVGRHAIERLAVLLSRQSPTLGDSPPSLLAIRPMAFPRSPSEFPDVPYRLLGQNFSANGAERSFDPPRRTQDDKVENEESPNKILVRNTS